MRDETVARQLVGLALQFADQTGERDRMRISALDHQLANRPKEAIAVYEALLERFPDDKEAFIDLGNIYYGDFEVQDVPKSIDLFNKAQKLDPLFKGVYNSLAYAYDALGNYERSIWAINEYIKLAPTEPNPYDSRGELYANSGQVELALASYFKAIELDSNFGSAYDGAISMLFFLQRYDQAERLCALLLSQSNPDVRGSGRWNKLRVSLHRGRLREALRLALSARNLEFKESGESVGSLAYNREIVSIYATLGEGKAAWATAQETEDLADRVEPSGRGGDFVLVRSMRSHFVSKDTTFVDSLVSEARLRIEGRPKGDSAWYHEVLGLGSLATGRFDSAIVYLQRAYGMQKSWIELFNQGRAYSGAGQLRDALQMFERALKSHEQSRWWVPVQSVMLHYYLATAYEKSGRSDLAIEQYREFLDIWKDADFKSDELKDAKVRLAALTP